MTTVPFSTEAPRLFFRLPLDPARLARARERMRDYLHQQSVEPDTVRDVVLAIEEAVTNAVRHSHAGDDLEVSLWFEGCQLVAQVSDHGQGFDISRFDPEALPDLFATGGRGLYLMARLMDEMELCRDDGIRVRMRKRCEPRESVEPLSDTGLPGDAGSRTSVYHSLRQRAFAEEMAEVFSTLDWEYRVSYANRAGLDFFGLGLGDVLGRSYWELFPHTIQMPIGQAVRHAMETGISAIEEYVSPRTGRWVETRVYPTGSGISIYLRDIDGRKRKELERDALLEVVRRSEEKYRTLFDSIDEGFCIIDVLFDDEGRPNDYRFLEINPAFERQTGLVGVIGRRMRDLEPAHEVWWYETYGRIAVTGIPQRFQQAADALGRYYDVYAFKIGDPQERRVAVLFNDVSERIAAIRPPS